MKKEKNMLAICGSLRMSSSNASILQMIGTMLPDHISYTIYDGPGSLPHFDPGADTANVHPAVMYFREQLSAADAVVICTPEYAFGVPGTLKNALDWTVSSAHFDDKPVALITASSKGDKAHASLLHTLTALNAKVTPETALLIPFIRSKMNPQNQVSDATTLQGIRGVVQALIAGIGS